MVVYQIWAHDSDRSHDKDDYLPTNILFDAEDKALDYIDVCGGDYYPVKVR